MMEMTDVIPDLEDRAWPSGGFRPQWCFPGGLAIPVGSVAALRLLRMVPVRYLRLLSQEEKQLQLLMPAPSPHLRSCATLPADPDGEDLGTKWKAEW